MTSSSKSATEGGAVNADAAPVKRYSLFTAICLIVGICIGSGIFFKSDNILIATDGNVALGVAMMLLAATTIVFGGLTLARFAARTTGHGGLIAYAEEFLGPRRAAFIGWNFTFLYMPIVCSVLSWVVGVYACMTFNLPGTFAWQMGIGLVFLLACTAWNILWPTLSGYFQNLTTLAKALPLVLVGVIGLMVNDPVAQLSSDIAAALQPAPPGSPPPRPSPLPSTAGAPR
ncbi:MAG: amino acid permease [Collinsella sp.]